MFPKTKSTKHKASKGQKPKNFQEIETKGKIVCQHQKTQWSNVHVVSAGKLSEEAIGEMLMSGNAYLNETDTPEVLEVFKSRTSPRQLLGYATREPFDDSGDEFFPAED
jgi:hypothetical protein